MSDRSEGDADTSALFDELEELEELVDDPEERDQVREAMEAAAGTQEPAVFGRVIWGFDRADAAEAALGALLFGIPMAVEGGTNEAGAFIAAHPLALAATLLGTVAIVHSILYVAEFQDVRVRDPILGFVPRRMAGVLLISAILAVALLTVWGRVTWAAPAEALGSVVVAMCPMSVGASLGDILPGT